MLCNALHLLERKDWHLHVYSSFEIYGWKENNEPFKELFEHIEKNPNVMVLIRNNNTKVGWRFFGKATLVNLIGYEKTLIFAKKLFSISLYSINLFFFQ